MSRQGVAIFGHLLAVVWLFMVSWVEEDTEREIVVSLCRELVAERKRLGISQQRLSEMAGISRTGLRHLESLQTNSTLYTILKVAKSLGFDLGEFFRKLDS